MRICRTLSDCVEGDGCRRVRLRAFGATADSLRQNGQLALAGTGQGLPAVARPKGERRLVALTGASWNQISPWLRQIDALRQRPLLGTVK